MTVVQLEIALCSSWKNVDRFSTYFPAVRVCVCVRACVCVRKRTWNFMCMRICVLCVCARVCVRVCVQAVARQGVRLRP